MRRKTLAAALIGGSLLTAGATLTTGVAWAGDDAPTTMRIVTTEEPAETTTGAWDCPEKNGTGGTGGATPDESTANL
jgi:hypothetical protein